MAEWTIMFYMCGSDLESKYGYATGNLQEIAEMRLSLQRGSTIMMRALRPEDRSREVPVRTGA